MRKVVFAVLLLFCAGAGCATMDGIRQKDQAMAAKDARLERDCVDRVILFSRAAEELAERNGGRPSDYYYAQNLDQCLGVAMPKHKAFHNYAVEDETYSDEVYERGYGWSEPKLKREPYYSNPYRY